MKNEDRWEVNRFYFDEQKGKYFPSKKYVYPGSLHIASLQIDAYVPLIEKYCTGDLLDCSCGQVPYYGIYKKNTSSVTCIDWESTHGENPYLDKVVDLNEAIPFPDNSFDSVLLTDVIAHIYKPHDLFKEISRILRPGGHLLVMTPFFYWISEPPYEYFRYTEYALSRMSEDNKMSVVSLEPYGGRLDIFFDVLNKKMTGKLSNRLFLLISGIVKRLGWYRRVNERTQKKFPIGYCLVAQKQ